MCELMVPMNDQPILYGSTMFSPTQFPLRIMRVPSHGVSAGQHQHDFTELVVILDGVGKHEVGNELYSIAAGDVFVLLGGMSHAYREVDNLYLVNILLDMPRLGLPLADLGGLPGYHALFEVEPQLRRHGQFQNRLRLPAEQLATVAALIAEIEAELGGRQRGGQFLAIAHLMRLIGYLSRCYSQGQPDDNRPIVQISRLLGYLERHYAEPLAIDDMLAVAHLSQSSLMRTFRQSSMKTSSESERRPPGNAQPNA